MNPPHTAPAQFEPAPASAAVSATPWITRLVQSRAALGIVVTAFVLLGVMTSLKTPLYQGYDEGGHALYVEHYALGRPLVNLDKTFDSGDPAAPLGQTHEATQPPLYYWLMGRVVSFIPRGDLVQEQVIEVRAPNGMYGNFLPADDGSLGTGQALAGHVVRFLTVLMGAVAVVCSYFTARLITQRPEIALLTAALMAFNPRNLVLSAQISNDMAVACTAALTLLLATYIVVKPSASAWWYAALLGLGAGASLLMKYSGGGVAVAAGAAILLRAWRFKTSWRVAGVNLVVMGLAALVAVSWYFLHNWQLYGDVLAWNRVTAINVPSTGPRTLQNALSWIPYIIQTNFAHPVYTYRPASLYTTLMFWLMWVAAAGVLWLAWRRRAGLGLYLLIWGPMLIAMLVNVITFIPWFLVRDATQNMRFFSPVFVPITLLFVLGCLAFVPRRWHAGLALGVTVIYGLFTAVTLYQGFNLMYAYPRYVDGPERQQLIDRDYAGRVRYANGIELLDVQIKQHRLNPGEPIVLSIVWRTTEPLTQSAHLMLDVRDEQDQTIASLNTANYVRYAYAPRAWQVGVPVREEYEIVPQTSKSQVVRVLAGWFEHNFEQFIPIRPVNNASVSVEVARAKLHVPSSAPAPAQQPVARLAGLVDLLEARIEGDEVILRWQATAEPERNATIFVHGLDGQRKIVAQGDVPFDYSAVYWSVGDVFEQRIPVPNLSGAQAIEVGVYDPDSQQRFRASQADGAPWAGDAVVVK